MFFLPSIVSSLRDDSSEVKRRALYALKSVSKANSLAMVNFVPTFGVALAECLKDGSTPVRLAAEQCALHAFQLTKGVDNVQAAQKYITDLDARRLSNFPEHRQGSPKIGLAQTFINLFVKPSSSLGTT